MELVCQVYDLEADPDGDGRQDQVDDHRRAEAAELRR
jgi:hypothetical protein